MSVYQIKPLVCVEGELQCFREEAVFCDLNIWSPAYFAWLREDPIEDCEWQFSYCICEYYDQDSSNYNSLDEAKQAAESWYRNKLLEALEEVK